MGATAACGPAHCPLTRGDERRRSKLLSTAHALGPGLAYVCLCVCLYGNENLDCNPEIQSMLCTHIWPTHERADELLRGGRVKPLFHTVTKIQSTVRGRTRSLRPKSTPCFSLDPFQIRPPHRRNRDPTKATSLAGPLILLGFMADGGAPTGGWSPLLAPLHHCFIDRPNWRPLGGGREEY